MADQVELTERTEEGIAALLVGRKVVRAEVGEFDFGATWGWASGRLTLDDGRRVFVVPNQGCGGCPSGAYSLTYLAAVDNIITSVRLAAFTEQDEYGGPTRYEIFVVADATEINLLTVDGDDGNGEYGTGYTLVVTAAE